MARDRQTSSTIASSLEDIRTRLLDLSARNRLLNYRHGRKNNLRIIDELPDQLHELLMSEEELRFLPIMEPTREQLIEASYISIDIETGNEVQIKKNPTAEEWARHLGFYTSYELPDAKSSEDESANHCDKAMQTMLFPYELESRLRGLRSKATTSIEETGTNILYMAFGFLEWFENSNSDSARLAPLMLIPVQLSKGKLNRKLGIYEYTIAYSGDDILPNLSLREKLRVDFGLILPELDDSTKPEEYLAMVRELVAHNKPRWRIRKYATIALLNFSKLLMYLDLDVKRWPKNKPITEHPILKSFFEKIQNPDSGCFEQEYNIDELPDIHKKYPLIEDADSSQHSALVDAINGHNLVIEGPPGTGKSQTITNLIAAAIAQGKRVLFVAEKLAALEVVKRRLDNVGLGIFCLELHSHKMQKRKVMENVASRIAKQGHYRYPDEIDADIARLEALKNKLRTYADLINSTWKETGKSVHAILMTATRFRQQLNIDPASIHPDGLDGNSFTPETLREHYEIIDSYGAVSTAVEKQLSDACDLSSHPWYGVNNTEIQFFEIDRIREALNSWQSALRQVESCRLEIQALLENRELEIPNALTDITQLLEDIECLPKIYGDEHFKTLFLLQGDNLQAFHEYLNHFREIQHLYDTLAKDVSPEILADLSLIRRLETCEKELRSLGLTDATDFNSIISLLQRVDLLEQMLQEISKPVTEILERVGSVFQKIGLHEQGLKELQQIIELSIMIEPNLLNFRDKIFDNEELDQFLQSLQTRIKTLRNLQTALSKVFRLESLPTVPEMEKIQAQLIATGKLSWLKRDWRAARKNLLSLTLQPKQKLKYFLPRLDSLINYAKDKKNLNNDENLSRLLGKHNRGLDTDIDELLKVREWYKQIRQCYGLGFGPKVDFGQAVIEMPVDVVKGIRSLVDRGFTRQLREVVQELSDLKSIFNGVEELCCGNVSLIGHEGVLQSLKESLTHSLSSYQKYSLKENLTINELEILITALVRLRNLSEQWVENDLDAKFFRGTLGLISGPCKNNEVALEAAEHTELLASILDNKVMTEVLKEAIYDQREGRLIDNLITAGQQLRKIWSTHQITFDAFSQFTDLDFSAWTRKSGAQLDSLILRNTRALEKPEWLDKFLDYIRIKQSVVDLGFRRLAKAVEEGSLSSREVKAGYNLAVFDLLCRQILRDIPALAQFSSNTQETIRRHFCKYDEKLKKLQQELIAYRVCQNEVPYGNSGRRVSEYTEMALLRKECSKKRRHIPIRQLVKRAGKALSALKPCFMMGPMSVAQYLEPGGLEFDLVVMDEASQIKPEEALGAIARGGQLVVVGDPNQLPPTSFFDKIIEDEEDDVTVLEESESILDAAFPRFQDRRLRWHYRSQHESLIAFSNSSFYDGELVLFPSPQSESSEYGVKLIRVPKGKFVDRRNLEETRVIAEAVKKHFLERPNESLGVVAMNIQQRDYIDRAVETLSTDDPLFQVALEQDQNRVEKLFIKNLENVQGDERDVMFISMTYGPQEVGGRVMQRFGPINSDVGWRRLNVLFTRAKKRMHIFTSMGSQDIILSNNSKRGVKALRDFLTYAETGLLHKTYIPGREPDSDFEIAVSEALGSEGFKCEHQVGVAGFYIDIAIVDPGNPGRYLMGIECDGASYHSAKSVRDRDRLRQAILERLGWQIRRIWSTDWYKNPQAQLQPIISELNAMKTVAPIIFKVEPETEAIEAIVEHTEKEADQVSESTSGETLREVLRRFDHDVIWKAYPNTPKNQRLLRPAMIDALLENMPTTKWEFRENIPPYLRTATKAEEGKYLDRVLEFINEA